MNRIIGVILIVISAASFGTLAIFGRYAYAAGLDIFTLLFLRFTFSALLMAVLLIFRRESLPRGGTFGRLVGMGALGYVGQSFSYLTAIKYASAGLVALLLYLYPTIVAVLSTIFLKEKINRVKIIALGLATLGAALTANPQGGQWTGILLALSAAAIYSVYIIVGTGVMQQVSAVQSSTVIFAAAGIVYGALTAINGPHWPVTSAGWLALAAVTLIATVIPVATFLAGLKRIGPTDASMLSTLEPVVTVLLAALLFGEALPPVTLLGGGLILAAVLLLTRGELRQSRTPEHPQTLPPSSPS
ncbi:MAG: DMT family transporter [Anaerolineales bacterium]|nr:DMT family transporter [Anaerolineales bacterium]